MPQLSTTIRLQWLIKARMLGDYINRYMCECILKRRVFFGRTPYRYAFQFSEFTGVLRSRFPICIQITRCLWRHMVEITARSSCKQAIKQHPGNHENMLRNDNGRRYTQFIPRGLPDKGLFINGRQSCVLRNTIIRFIKPGITWTLVGGGCVTRHVSGSKWQRRK